MNQLWPICEGWYITQSLFLVGYGLHFVVLFLLSIVVAFAFTLVALVAVVMVQLHWGMLWECTLKLYRVLHSILAEYIYITKILACVTGAKSLL